MVCATMSIGEPALMRAVTRRTQVPEVSAPEARRGWLPETE
jgi:hypothetical protein